MGGRSVSAAAIFAGLALLAFPRDAAAQACCAGSAAAAPARLMVHEDALVGLTLRGASVRGSFDGDGKYRPNPSGSGETDFEEDVVGAIRFLDRGQASVLVPLLETRRTVPRTTEVGGGLGDVVLGARWDATLSGASPVWPGIAFLAGLTLPTGRPVDAAKKPLATDATGTGALGASIGLGLEQRFDRVYVGATGTVAYRTPHTAQAIREQLAPLWTALFAVAWTPGDAAIGVSIAASYEGDASIDGTKATGTARRATTVSLAGATPIAGAWRGQAALFATPWASGFGENQSASLGATLTGIYAWM